VTVLRLPQQGGPPLISIQHYADGESRFTFEAESGRSAVLSYTDLTDGKERFTDETFSLGLEVDSQTGDLLVTPAGQSPRPGVYAANLTLAPLAPAVTAEAPITDGVRITRENTGEVLWMNKWPDYWQYGFVAFNGWKKGAFAIWTQDQRIRYYKSLIYLKNNQGLSFALSMMNVPPSRDSRGAAAHFLGESRLSARAGLRPHSVIASGAMQRSSWPRGRSSPDRPLSLLPSPAPRRSG